jgi:cobyrinic acid a,c-diamide synthase
MKSMIIAAPQSGSGKTTVTLALMECLKRRGLTIAPFKVGPDFIDPGYHRLVCGVPSINLDPWMCSPEFVLETFIRNSAGKDVAIVEGVMGLFDGISGVSDQGSTAHVAKIVGSPVILVVDARSQARSAAALVQGFARFDPRVRIAGVIFNNVGSEQHARILREAVESLELEIPVVGCIPRDSLLDIPSRHLGLVTAEENPLSQDFRDHLATVVRDSIDLALLWAVCKPPVPELAPLDLRPTASPPARVRIGVARDAAFCFAYSDNLRLLRLAGAEVVPFSPLSDAGLPEELDGLYLPGGYPELFAETLAANRTMVAAVGDAVAAGMPVYAECGGFIYLTRGVHSVGDGHSFHEFVGVFPVKTTMLPRRRALGYREVEFLEDSIIARRGETARGHEFHYSEMEPMPESVERIYRVKKSGHDLGLEGFRQNNCLASYLHLHFGSSPVLAETFVEACLDFRGAP